MQDGCGHELEYLRVLTQKYGNYLKQYFGFTLKDMAAKIGINPKLLLMVIHDQRNMPEKHVQRFIEVFKEMDIENRTKDFKPSKFQLEMRELWRKIRLDKRGISAIILITMANTIFLNPPKVTCLQYIRCEYAKLTQKTYNVLYKATTKNVVAFFIFLKRNVYFLHINRISDTVFYL